MQRSPESTDKATAPRFSGGVSGLCHGERDGEASDPILQALPLGNVALQAFILQADHTHKAIAIPLEPLKFCLAGTQGGSRFLFKAILGEMVQALVGIHAQPSK